VAAGVSGIYVRCPVVVNLDETEASIEEQSFSLICAFVLGEASCQFLRLAVCEVLLRLPTPFRFWLPHSGAPQKRQPLALEAATSRF
jgi:hypothetical protein